MKRLGFFLAISGLCASLASAEASDFYVSPSGSDSNNCLAATVGGGNGPCLTLQHTVNQALTTDAQSTNLFINVAAGTYNAGFTLSGTPRGAASGGLITGVWVKGAGSSTTIINDTQDTCGTIIASNAGVNIVLQGVTISKSAGCGGGGSGIFAQGNAYVATGGDVSFGPAGAQHMHAEGGAQIEVTADYKIVGNANAHWGVSTNGRIAIDGYAITCALPLTFTNFAFAQSNGVIIMLQPTHFVGCGSVSGRRYAVLSNATIDANGVSGDIIPGSAPGLIESQGWYEPMPVPTIGSCLNGVIAPYSSDRAIAVNFHGSSSSCAINFATFSPNPRICTASNTAGIALGIGTVSNTVTVQSSFVNTETLYITCHTGP